MRNCKGAWPLSIGFTGGKHDCGDPIKLVYQIPGQSNCSLSGWRPQLPNAIPRNGRLNYKG